MTAYKRKVLLELQFWFGHAVANCNPSVHIYPYIQFLHRVILLFRISLLSDLVNTFGGIWKYNKEYYN